MLPLRSRLPVRWASLLLLVLIAPQGALGKEPSFSTLAERIERIDEQMPGNLGVYVKRLDDGEELNHRTDRNWYLASTIKIPLAIAVLQQVEAGELSLTQTLEVAESDYVDGSGELLYAEPGSEYTVDQLIQRSTEHSDSTATDMLIRLLGEKAFNRRLQEAIAEEGFNRITTIVQVRNDAYGEVHENAAQLNNLDFIDLKRASALEERYERLLEKLEIEPKQAGAASINEAFERYYQRGINSGDLNAMGSVLEKLVRGEYLNADNTERLLGYMRNVNTGDRRIKAGLPEGASFAHKTGTQINRACNVGIVNSDAPENAVVVAACAEGFGSLAKAEKAFAEVGRALNDADLVL